MRFCSNLWGSLNRNTLPLLKSVQFFLSQKALNLRVLEVLEWAEIFFQQIKSFIQKLTF